MKKIDFNIFNIVIWHKSDPQPFIYKNKFGFSYEFIIWAKKGNKHYFDYDEKFNVNNQEMEDVWLMDAVQMSEKKHGLITSIEFLKALLKQAKEEAAAEKEVVPSDEIIKGVAALTDLFNRSKIKLLQS